MVGSTEERAKQSAEERVEESAKKCAEGGAWESTEESMEGSSKENAEKITEETTMKGPATLSPPLATAAHAIKNATFYRTSDKQSEKSFVLSPNTRLFLEVKKTSGDD